MSSIKKETMEEGAQNGRDREQKVGDRIFRSHVTLAGGEKSLRNPGLAPRAIRRRKGGEKAFDRSVDWTGANLVWHVGEPRAIDRA